MFETYPKKSAHPSSSVGEQDGKSSWNAPRKTSYRNTTVKDTVYNGNVVKTKSCDTGAGKYARGDKQVSVRYPKKLHEKFGSEK